MAGARLRRDTASCLPTIHPADSRRGCKIKQARDTVEFAYERGAVTLLDYLDAQRNYREKSLEYFRSLGNYHTAIYQLESAIGSERPPSS